MRELTMYELDGQLAEQLPARELMGRCWSRGGNSSTHTSTATANAGDYQQGLVNVDNTQVNLLSFGNSNGGNYASATASS